MEDKSKKYTTINLFEIAAIKYVSNIDPDDYLVEENSRLGVAVYNDKSKLPPRADIQHLLDFSTHYTTIKKQVFALVDNRIKQGEPNETDRTH